MRETVEKKMKKEIEKLQEELTILLLILKNSQVGGINEVFRLQAKKLIGIMKRLLAEISDMAYVEINEMSDQNYIADLGYFYNVDEIEINEDEPGLWHIALPALLPRKKEKYSVDNYGVQYRMPIYRALEKKNIIKKPFLLKRAAILIIHNFAEDSKLIDYDNFDYTHLINCVANFIITDDGPDCYSLHIIGKDSDRDYSYTETFIFEESSFQCMWNRLMKGEL